MTTRRILLFSRDPGATNHLVAFRELVEGGRERDFVDHGFAEAWTALGLIEGTETKIGTFAKAFAHAVWNAAGAAPEDWGALVPDALADPQRNAAIDRLLQSREITGLVTGADDVDESDTVRLWRAARAARLPVVVLLDHTNNLDLRFSDTDGSLFVPDLVYALNQDSLDELRAVGLPESCLRIARNLHHARLKRLAGAERTAASRLRESWTEADNERVVLFASENTAEMAALRKTGGWDEFGVLERLVADIASGRSVGPLAPDAGPVVVVVRPHPRDTAGKYDRFQRAADPRVIVSGDGTPAQAAQAADVVVGMDSALLYEARLLGTPAVSVIPESAFNRTFATAGGATRAPRPPRRSSSMEP